MSNPKTLHVILLLFCFYTSLSTTAQGPDSAYPASHYRYFSATLLTGVGFLLSGNNDGVIRVGFPYTVTNSSGVTSDSLFTSRPTRPYSYPKVFLFPLSFESGGLRHFISMGFSFPLVGNSTGGYNFYAGYGYNFYINGFTHRSRHLAQKAWLIRPSLSFHYTQDNGFNDPAELGTIDNANKSILLFGQVAGPTFTITQSYGRSTSTVTYSAKTLDISYAQYELSIMPRIIISSNPYLHGLRWALTVGYNIPWHETGRIQLIEDDGAGNKKGLTSPIHLTERSISASYNNKPITSAPFRFSGLFLNLEMNVVHFRYRKFKPATSRRGLFGRRKKTNDRH